MRIQLIASLATFASIASFPHAASAQTRFRDVPKSHVAHEAILDLASRGVLRGYSDGTFRMKNFVNRAEMAAILVRSFLAESQYDALKTSNFSDIPDGSWYLSYVEALKKRSVVDGPPKRDAFEGERPVLLAEFLKMLFLLDGQNVGPHQHIEFSLAEDVDDRYQWYFPYMVHGVKTTMITPYLDAKLYPGKQLTRADVALYMHRYLLYREGKHVDRAQELYDLHMKAFYTENNAVEDSDLAEQFVLRATLLAEGLFERDTGSLTFAAMKELALAAQQLYMGEPDEARSHLQRAEKFSPLFYNTYYEELR